MANMRCSPAHRRAMLPVRGGLILCALAVICMVCDVWTWNFGAPSRPEAIAGRRLGHVPGANASAVICPQPGACVSESEEHGLKNAEKPTLQLALMNGFGLFYMFVALYLVCDEFFVPSLDVVSEKLGLSPDVAGATFMAAGGSAPEFFTSLVGAVGSPTPSEVGIAAIVGSAVFNVLFVIGACGIASPRTLELTWYPLARDSIFYLIDLLAIVWVFQDSQVTLVEAAGLFGLYVLYCIFMCYSSRIEKRLGVSKPERDGYTREFENLDKNKDSNLDKKEALASAPVDVLFNQMDTNNDGLLSYSEFHVYCRRTLTKKLASSSTVSLPTPTDPSTPAGADAEDNEPLSLCPPGDAGVGGYLWYILTLPLALILVFSVPDVRRPGCCWKNLYVPGFVLSILWIAVFSKYMVEFTEVVGAYTGIPINILALTLLAWGTSVPDLLTSVLVTLQGHGDMAVSSSIGSNIFDVTVGLPIPWMIFIGLRGTNFPVESNGLVGSILMLVGMLVFTIGSIMMNKWVLNKMLGIMMLVLWTAFTLYSIYAVISVE